MNSPANATGEPNASLQTFMLTDLAQYTKEKAYSANASKDFHLFFVGRDDVHSILVHVLSRATVSIYLNMFGYDDDELNSILMAKAVDPNITMLITLDKSQAGSKTEKALIALDETQDLSAFNTHFVLGESATHQISHTKGFVVDGKVGGEGSTNWSNSGEGTFVVASQAGGPNYKAQNNTQSIFCGPGYNQPLFRRTYCGAYDRPKAKHGKRHPDTKAGEERNGKRRQLKSHSEFLTHLIISS